MSQNQLKMNENKINIVEKGYGLIEIPHNSDSRGSLCFAEWKHLPFEAKRVFWIHDVQPGKTRGGHAHGRCAEVVFAVNGSFDMYVDNGKQQDIFHICDPCQGIYIGPNVWCELRNFAPGTVCVVVASAKYMKSGYINDYATFKEVHANDSNLKTPPPLMRLVRYTHEHAEEWNRFIAESKNGTFLLDRNYMDYHSDRFEDCSLLFVDKERIFAAFPANFDRNTLTVYSHQGLTYGGLIMSKEIDAARVLDAFQQICDFYCQEYGAKRVVYKPIPYIYNTCPSDEYLYALFRMNARLISRGLSTTIDLQNPIPLERSRRNALKKAAKNHLHIEESEDYAAFWNILNSVLTTRHDVTPVHSVDELKLLHDRFPDRIRLFVVKDTDENIIAGSYIFICGNVVHTQYMAATEQARHVGGLDFLIAHLMEQYSQTCRYFDFGISTEADGTYLNRTLIYQKEGFGGRGTVYDQYEIEL